MPPSLIALTTADVERTLLDDRHLGFGYASSLHLPHALRARLDASVVAVANELGLDYEQLFAWSNSKYGRWLTGHGPASVSLGVVRKYLNAEAIRVLAEGAS